jgi:MtfA peptidase
MELETTQVLFRAGGDPLSLIAFLVLLSLPVSYILRQRIKEKRSKAILGFHPGPAENSESTITRGSFKMPPYAHEKLLFTHFKFYRHLSNTERAEFNRRITLFIASREFQGRQGLEVGINIKTLIAASPIMLTFGMNDFMLPHFRLIIIYPEAYLNQLNNSMHKGETNSSGVVVLSWADYYEGISCNNDGINLGLHEFAHSLAIQTEKGLWNSSQFTDALHRLMNSVANQRFRQLISQRAGLRPYATENPMEFFAVATEVFFEKPEVLRSSHPTIYQLFTEMFSLDLAGIYAREINPLKENT